MAISQNKQQNARSDNDEDYPPLFHADIPVPDWLNFTTFRPVFFRTMRLNAARAKCPLRVYAIYPIGEVISRRRGQMNCLIPTNLESHRAQPPFHPFCPIGGVLILVYGLFLEG